ncbi:hypothetical protein R6G69_06645, partial [Actinotignum urinale]|uniref:hypothetical protein n=1 Tax=Actinotignum urinale TaxID=190146 RepID=UPI002A7FC24C
MNRNHLVSPFYKVRQLPWTSILEIRNGWQQSSASNITQVDSEGTAGDILTCLRYLNMPGSPL